MSTLPAAFTRTASDITAEVMMTRSAFSGAILLVEGSTDSRFIKRHVLPSTQVTICNGKGTLLAAVAQMAALQIAGFLAIVDRDLDERKGITFASPIFATDTYDLETLLLSFRFRTVLTELGDADRVSAFEQVAGTDVVNALLERGESFSKLRYLNDIAPRFGLELNGMSPWKYIDMMTWVLDENKLHADFSSRCGHSVQSLQAFLIGVAPMRTWSDVRGHDVLAILSIGLRKVLGNGKQISEDHLSSALRLAFNEADFRLTQLYAGLKQWEQTSGLPILSH